VGGYAQPGGGRPLSDRGRTGAGSPTAEPRAARACYATGAPHVIVLGGGVAGIVAALDCADAGARVSLLEVRPRLGGAAYSFERDGLRLDNGQHVFLRCCGAYRALLERLGSSGRVRVQPRLEIPVLSPGAKPAVLRRGGLPAPLHLAGALLRYPHLTLAQRVSAGRAALALGRLNPQVALELERAAGVVPGEQSGTREEGASTPGRGTATAGRGVTMVGRAGPGTLGAWLAERGQSPASVAALWDLIALPTLNLPAAEGSLALGAFVLRTGLLERADAGDIGFHMRPLSETLGEPAERALARAGVDVRLGARAERVARSEDGLRVRASGAEFDADAVVCAIPHQRAAGLLEPLLGERATRWNALGASPIVNVHVVYDRRVCELEFAAGVGTPVQYVFDRTDAAGLAPAGSHAGDQAGAGGQCLSISLSGAEEDMRRSSEELRERYVDALAELFPRARDARVQSVHVSREHAATFRAAPGTQELRPGARTRVRGLVLAGAWTDTGWPATLEGAVLSGHAAAREALGSLALSPSSSRLSSPTTSQGADCSAAPPSAAEEDRL
jgi:hydroxysqualene dehydroxylase